MFDNKDFNKFTHGLMIFATMMAYNSVYEYSRFFNITWVNVPFASLVTRKNPPLTPDSGIIYLTFFFLIPALILSLRSCIIRIKAKEVYWKKCLKNWMLTLFGYLIALLLLLILFPLLARVGRFL